jgi:hypothetical protein
VARPEVPYIRATQIHAMISMIPYSVKGAKIFLGVGCNALFAMLGFGVAVLGLALLGA